VGGKLDRQCELLEQGWGWGAASQQGLCGASSLL
jgi:hypothetical protein